MKKYIVSLIVAIAAGVAGFMAGAHSRQGTINYYSQLSAAKVRQHAGLQEKCLRQEKLVNSLLASNSSGAAAAEELRTQLLQLQLLVEKLPDSLQRVSKTVSRINAGQDETKGDLDRFEAVRLTAGD